MVEAQGRRVGIFGGSFNPIHNGHLLIARELVERLQLDEIRFIPARMSPHKLDAPDMAPAEHRLAMIELAIAGEERMSSSNVEIRREGPSWTVETLKELSGNEPGVEWILLMGSDAIADLNRWKDVPTICSLASVAYYVRPGEEEPDLSALREQIGEDVNIRRVDGPRIDLSATGIRERIHQGLSVDDLVPAGVAEYIREHGLYGEVA
jgi:nicotinate-nucleotide adenylyltransferase